MARLLYLSTGFVVVFISVSLSYLATIADKQHKIELTSIVHSPIYIQNNAKKDVALFASTPPFAKPIGVLKHKEGYPFVFSGKSGGWLYGAEVFIKDPNRIKAVALFSQLVPLNLLKYSYAVGLVALLIISILAWINRVKSQRVKIAERIIANQQQQELMNTKQRLFQKDQKFDRLQQDLKRQKLIQVEFETKSRQQSRAVIDQEREKRIDAERSVAAKTQQINQLKNSLQQQKTQQAQCKVELVARSEVESKALAVQFRKKEMELRRQFENDAKIHRRESEQSIKISVEHMKDEYDKLNKKYLSLEGEHARLKKEAAFFDVKFDGTKYKNLLTGRLYEIYFAKKLLKDNLFEILSWTSDKGFENGVSVKSNGDPDFLIQDHNKHIFAVECKYRCRCYAKKGPNGVFWCYTSQMQRYQVYQRERNVPVFVVIGIAGEADNPKDEYFIGLDRLATLSQGRCWGDNKLKKEEQQVAAKEEIQRFYISKKSSYPQRILELMFKDNRVGAI